MIKKEKLLPLLISKDKLDEEDQSEVAENTITPNNEAEGEENKHLKLWKRIPCLGLMMTVLRVTMTLTRQAGIKELTDINPLVFQFYQSMFSLSMSIPWAVAVDKSPFPSREPKRVNSLIILRAVSTCLSSMAVYFALQNMSIGNYSMVISTQPIFVIILARIFLAEPCGLPEIFSIFLLLSGVVFVVKPPFLFPQDLVEEAKHGDNYYLAVGLLLLGTVMAGNVRVILRHLRKQHIASLTASKDIIGVILIFLTIMVSGIKFSNHPVQEKLKIFAFAISFVIESNMNLVALKVEEAGKIDLVDRCVNIVGAFTIQIIYFGDIPDLYTCGGIGFVLMAICVMGTKAVCGERFGKCVTNKQEI